MDGTGLISSNDGEVFLGRISSNCYGSDSITNRYGSYGSPYASNSILNEYGTYGSPYSSRSAFNTLASSPPIVWMPDGTGYYAPFAYITINTFKTPRIDSNYLIVYLRAKGGC